MFALVRPPVDAQPMAEMPQWLINGPCCMMEDGPISGSPPEPGTGGSRGLWHELAPRLVPSAGRTGEVYDHGSLHGARVTNPLVRVAKTTRRLDGRSLITSCWSSAHPFPCGSGWLSRLRNGSSQHAERDDWVRRRRGEGRAHYGELLVLYACNFR